MVRYTHTRGRSRKHFVNNQIHAWARVFDTKPPLEMTEPRAPDSDEVDSDDEVGSDEAPVTGPDEWTVHYDE